MTKFIKLSATIALLWFVSAQATPLRAQQGQNYDFKVGKLYYKITDDANREVTVVSEPKTYPYYTDRPTGDVSIPAIVVKDGKAYRVTGIGDDAFCGYTTLNSITIPNSVTVIGEAAFAGCTGLVSVALPYGLARIEMSVFEYCTSLTSIDIPDGVTEIGHRAFANCTSLSSVSLPKSLNRMGVSVFSGCTNLTSIAIPDSVTTIGVAAFANCASLASVVLPCNDSVWIGEYVFYGCRGLQSVTVGWQEPLRITEDMFDDIDLSKVILTVPSGTKEAYLAADIWQKFKITEEYFSK